MNNDREFIEQEAPEKNTDNAFIEVGANGSPVLPGASDKKTDIEKDQSSTTLDKR
ncbi:hypothetical protein [Segetibacter koreensis]|uniref:hypothetical protein n=1 Tax=Segetibacter koreensis TaxID=398037 RepID=UPI0003715BC5|nr:hypothetical protein [Segetibacter koreensis]